MLVKIITCSATKAPPTVILAPVGPVPKPDRPFELNVRCGLAAICSLSTSPVGCDVSSADRQPVDPPPCGARATKRGKGCALSVFQPATRCCWKSYLFLLYPFLKVTSPKAGCIKLVFRFHPRGSLSKQGKLQRSRSYNIFTTVPLH